MVPVFLPGDVLQCNIGHRSSVEVLCMLYKMYKIMRNSLHPFNDALLVLYVPVRLHVVFWSSAYL